MALYKNIASQKIAVYAHDTAADAPKTGDAANITAQISKDGAATAATNDTNPTELDATDAPGIYLFDMTQAETNADLVVLCGASSTGDVSIEPVIIYTLPGDNAGVDVEVVTKTGFSLAADQSGVTVGTVNALGAQAKLDVNAEADTALSDYDPPTAAELTSGLSGLNDISTADIAAELATYDGPTKAELDAGFAALNDPTAAAIADAVLDEALSGHVGAGSLGKAVADIETDATAILADTDELQTNQGDWATATGFSTHSASDVTTDIDANSTQLAAILADTNELQTDDIPGTIAALNDLSAADVNAEVVDVLRTDLIPDSYAADGAQPTIAQAILAIHQFLMERSVSSTTVTVKKPDGSTGAMTFTLDDGSAPTSITRAS